MPNTFGKPPLEKHPVDKWEINERLKGVCWLWGNDKEKLLEVLATADLLTTLTDLKIARSGPRAHVHFISFEEILDQEEREKRVQIAIERYKPVHQTPHLFSTDSTA
ncbi:MAG: hypothetical protein ABSB88_12970 [Bryobacteraceae bacterium]|jgi:hypothetical protein